MTTLLITLLLAVAALVVVTRGDTASPRTSSASFDPRCAVAYKAVRFYRAKTAAHRSMLGVSGLPALEQNASCPRLRERARYWRHTSRAHARVVAHHFAWPTWMPRGSKWYRVASCETGYGRDPNWQHDSGTYVSAFGIYRPGYADDAARIGNLSWDETKRRLGRLPTPREQYEAALSHYRAHGGFSGWGCRNA